MKIPLFSALWCLLRAVENFALAASALVWVMPIGWAEVTPVVDAHAAACFSVIVESE